jgi:hypothetical protein
LINDLLLIGDFRLVIAGSRGERGTATQIKNQQSTINNESTIKDRKSRMI